MNKIIAANNLSDPDRLIPGMELVIPDGKPLSHNNAVVARKSSVMVWPVSGKITSYYAYRIHPITGSREFHSGLDIAANLFHLAVNTLLLSYGYCYLHRLGLLPIGNTHAGRTRTGHPEIPAAPAFTC